MTMPTPTQAELEAAVALEKYLAEYMIVRYQIPTAQKLADFLAAHRAEPSATLAPTFNLDPAHDDKIARQEVIERARSVFADQPADPAVAYADNGECCNAMKHAIGAGYLEELHSYSSNKTHISLGVAIRKPGIVTFKINLCPWCGVKIETLERERSSAADAAPDAGKAQKVMP